MFYALEELSATRELYDAAAAPKGRALIIFNGELDRLRGGYYPGMCGTLDVCCGGQK